MQENILPIGFTGLFYFTNFTKEAFSARWGGIEYTFPPESSIPLIIATASPLEIQSIRKKFAKELAEREFNDSQKMKTLDKMNPQHTINNMNGIVTYNPKDLEPLVQRCLEPLPIAQATAKVLPTGDEVMEPKLSRDHRGRKSTRVLEKDESLIGDGQIVA